MPTDALVHGLKTQVSCWSPPPPPQGQVCPEGTPGHWEMMDWKLSRLWFITEQGQHRQ